MELRSRLVVLASFAVYVTLVRAAHAQEVCRTRIPPNVDAGVFGPTLLDVLDRSDTFRIQCRRIAASPVLRIRVSVVRHPDGDYRAITLISRYDSGALRADVILVFAENYVELLGHEFEHVLEQIEGVNLRAAGGSRQLESGAFETRRATSAGLQVLQEYEALAPEAARHHALRLR